MKNILLTSDDGYNSAGIRILIAALKERYNLKIAATLAQQSAVGGKISFVEGGKWGIDKVENIDAIWVDGTPSDAIECAKTYYNQNFDLCIAGVNYGINVGSTIASGTLAAAMRAVVNEMTNNSIAISWEGGEGESYNDHSSTTIDHLSEYPTKTVSKLVDYIIDNKYWGSKLVNVNLPKTQSEKCKFTQPYIYMSRVFGSSANLDTQSNRYNYVRTVHPMINDNSYDAVAVRNGIITITPMKVDLADDLILKDLSGKEFSIDI